MGLGLDKLYSFYADLLFYEYCPESMQTISLVEQIINEAKEVYLHNLLGMGYPDEMGCKTSYELARSFIQDLLNVSVEPEYDYSVMSVKMFTVFLDLLKSYARSNSVKSYFGL